MSQLHPPQPSLIALSACICGAVVDQDECPYPTGLPTGDERAIFKVNCTDPNCGWSAIGYGADGARKAWNNRPQSRPEAELPELPEPRVVTTEMTDGFGGDSVAYQQGWYDDDQLRAYGQQCAATRPAEVGGDGLSERDAAALRMWRNHFISERTAFLRASEGKDYEDARAYAEARANELEQVLFDAMDRLEQKYSPGSEVRPCRDSSEGA